jgi:hypothetical protein
MRGGLLRRSGYLEGKDKEESSCGAPSQLCEEWRRRVFVGGGRTLYGERLLDYFKVNRWYFELLYKSGLARLPIKAPRCALSLAAQA